MTAVHTHADVWGHTWIITRDGQRHHARLVSGPHGTDPVTVDGDSLTALWDQMMHYASSVRQLEAEIRSLAVAEDDAAAAATAAAAPARHNPPQTAADTADGPLPPTTYTSPHSVSTRRLDQARRLFARGSNAPRLRRSD